MHRSLLASAVVVLLVACSAKEGAPDSAASAGDVSGGAPANPANPSSPSAAAGAAAAGGGTEGQVTLSIQKSAQHAGSFRDAGTIARCGGPGKEFAVSFAPSGEGAEMHPLQGLTFNAADLAEGGSTKAFKLDATIQDLDMQKGTVKKLPPLSFDASRGGNALATLMNRNGKLQLYVEGTTDAGESVELTVWCDKRTG